MAHERDYRHWEDDWRAERRGAWGEATQAGYGRGHEHVGRDWPHERVAGWSGQREDWRARGSGGYGAVQDEAGWRGGEGGSAGAPESEHPGWRGAPHGEYGGGLGHGGPPPAMGPEVRNPGYGDRWDSEWGAAHGEPRRAPRLGYDSYSGMTPEPGYGPHHGAGRRGGYGEPRHEGWGGGPSHGYEARGYEDERGFWDRVSDKFSLWFADEEAARRREKDYRHYGRGPRNYIRSDERIREDVCDRLTQDPLVDATDIDVQVLAREVTLTGQVDSREAKRRAEDCADSVSGVIHVQNNLRVKGIHGAADAGVQQPSQTGASASITHTGFSSSRTGS